MSVHGCLPNDLAHYIIQTMFEQPSLDSVALIRGKLPGGELRTWLYRARKYIPISAEEHEQFRRAAKSRGGNYGVELCEFTIEEVMHNGDILLNFWRRTRDNTGEGGRVILSCRGAGWHEEQQLGGWENNA
ncbi:MAG TPA: hypothetical protein VMT34_11665 [Aggregatilineales bacterium]|nr:hypothetical protein [Aggregatilineales bacterium]